MMISVAVQVVIAGVLLSAAITLATNLAGSSSGLLSSVNETSIQEVGSSMYDSAGSISKSQLQLVKLLLALLCTVASSVWLLISAGRKWLTTPISDSSQLMQDVASGEIRKRLGFMHIIQKELKRIGDLLDDPNGCVPSFLDFLLPECLLGSAIHRGLAWLFGVAQTHFMPCRLVIFIDDLDRCDAEKALEVLQSMVLLTEGVRPAALYAYHVCPRTGA
jgi:hypothetical protein